jgi:hypothetical protein
LVMPRLLRLAKEAAGSVSLDFHTGESVNASRL